jgi:hypothetical protein
MKGSLDDGEIRGLKAGKDAAETLLKLVQEKEKVVTEQVEISNQRSTKVAAEVAALRREVVQVKALLPQSIVTQVDQVASTSATMLSTTRVLLEANNALRNTLSPPSASPTLSSETPSVGICRGPAMSDPD